MTAKEASKRLGQTVRYRKTQADYQLVGISKRWCNQGIIYQAELRDLKAHSSFCVCRVEDIEAKKENITS